MNPTTGVLAYSGAKKGIVLISSITTSKAPWSCWRYHFAASQCTESWPPRRITDTPSISCSAGAPGKDAVKSVTSWPHPTRRSAILCVTSSAPPAFGCLRQRQFKKRMRMPVNDARELSSLVVPKQIAPVEDGGGVDHDVPDIAHADAAKASRVVHRHWDLGDLVAAHVRNRQQLQVISEPLHHDPVHCVAKRLACKELDARLRVEHREAEKKAHQHIVAEAEHSPLPRVVHDGPRMHLRADDNVGARLLHRVQQRE